MSTKNQIKKILEESSKNYTPDQIQGKLKLLKDYEKIIPPSHRKLIANEQISSKSWYIRAICDQKLLGWRRIISSVKKDALEIAELDNLLQK